ncbi:MAG: thioredoxin family protein [Planctomycetales bacterium]|nr:thioredoxin family protein [Planctomycetales bacterium]
MNRSRFTTVVALALLLCANLPVFGQSAQHQYAGGNKIFTHSSIEQAWQLAVKEQRPLLVMFESDHCVYCRRMLSETYGHPAIRRMLARDAETVLAKAEDYRPLIKRMGIRGYPTTLVVSPEGKVLDVVEGFVDAKAFSERVIPLLAKGAPRVGEASASFK